MKKQIVFLFPLLCISLWGDVAGDYQNKCADCHGLDGKKTVYHKPISIAGKREATLIKEIVGYQEGRLNKYGMGGLMKAQVKQLPPHKIKELARYIATFKK